MVHLLFRKRRRRRRRRNSARLRKLRWLASGFALGTAFAFSGQSGALPVLHPLAAAGLELWQGFSHVRHTPLARPVARPAARSAAPQRGTRTTGLARVVDGDTVELNTGFRRVKVRLRALHAPELAQPGGITARRALERLAARGPFTCTATGRLTHGRTVADCRTATGEDVAAALIRAGVASHCERYGRADLARLRQPRRIHAARPAYCRA